MMRHIRVPKKYYQQLIEEQERMSKNSSRRIPLWEVIPEVERKRIGNNKGRRRIDDFFW